MRILIFLLFIGSLYAQTEKTAYELTDDDIKYRAWLINPNYTKEHYDSLLTGQFLNISVDSINYTKHDTRWDDLRFPATGLSAQNKNSAVPEFDTTNIGWLFDKANTESLFGIAQLPHSWKTGTDLSPHIHWSASASDTVVWEFSYKWAAINDTLLGTYTSDTIQVTAGTTINYHKLSGFADMDASSISGVSSIIKWKISRLGGHSNDDLNADALLWEVDFHYQIDNQGSRSEYIK